VSVRQISTTTTTRSFACDRATLAAGHPICIRTASGRLPPLLRPLRVVIVACRMAAKWLARTIYVDSR
jgi:hypothetical protein